MTQTNDSSPPPPARRARDVRVLALLLTVGLVVIGGLTLGFADRLPGFGQQQSAASQHVRQKKQQEIAQRFEQGVIMLHAKQYDHALTAFHRVIELSPEMPEAYANTGFALLGKGEFRAAADFFDAATSLNSGQINAYYGLAVALEGLGDKRTAIEAMRAYLHRAPADDPYRAKAEAAVWEWQAAVDAARKPGAR